MADQKISDLTEIAIAEVLETDEFALVSKDAAPDETKKMTVKTERQVISSRSFEVETGTVAAGEVVELVQDKARKGAGDNLIVGQNNDVAISVASLTADCDSLTETRSVHVGDGDAFVGNIVTDAITFGSAQNFATSTNLEKIIALTPSLVVVLYRNNAVSSGHLHVRAGTISGTTITWGTAVLVTAFVNTVENQISIDRLSDTHFVCVFENTGTLSQIAVGSVSGTTITLGTPVNLVGTGSAVHSSSVAALSSSEAIAVFFDGTDTQSAYITISGTVPTVNTPVEAHSGAADNPSLTAIDRNSVIYVHVPFSNDYEYQIISKQGLTLSITAVEGLFTITSRLESRMIGVGDNRFVAMLTNIGVGADVVIFQLTNGKLRQVGSSASVGGGNTTNGTGLARLSRGQIITSQYDSTATAIRAIVVDVTKLLGVAQTGATAPNNIMVATGGKSNIHSALVKGNQYYSDDGDLSNDVRAPRIGTAISTTELQLELEDSKA